MSRIVLNILAGQHNVKNWGDIIATLAIVVGLGFFLVIYVAYPPSIVLKSDNTIFKGATHGSTKLLPDMTIKQVLKEANDKFTYRGKPIHPGWLAAFDTGWAKYRPKPSSVDVSAVLNSNLYSGDVQKRDGWYEIYFNEGGSVGYKRTKSLFGIVHVLQVFYHGGGSQSLGEVFFVKFEIRKSRPKSEPFDRLILKLITSYDRCCETCLLC